MIDNQQVLSEEVGLLQRVSAQLDINRHVLLQQYNQALKETLFENRSQIRLSILPSTAESELEALISYFQRPSPEIAKQQGADLCKKGFSEKTLLRLGSTSRQFFFGVPAKRAFAHCNDYAGQLSGSAAAGVDPDS